MSLTQQRHINTVPHPLNVPATPVAPCEGVTPASVGLSARDLTALEVDLHIQDLGRLAEKAMADGDPTGAQLWTDRMYAAIASRTPEHQAAMDAEIERRIDDGAGYFAAQGELDRQRMEGAA